MRGDVTYGAFRGRKLIQRRGEIGGARSVFVKIAGIKNELIYPTFGGIIKNPFKGAAKMFAGDLIEYRTDANGVKPEIYILKTYKLHKQASGITEGIEIERTKYSHKIFVGDKIAVAPSKIGGTVTTSTVLAVEEALGTEDQAPVWKITVDAAITGDKGAVLVETDGSTHMLVKKINAVADADMDMLDVPADAVAHLDDDFDNARYFYTPALGGVMYINRMSAMPKCVLDVNESKVNGWFKIQF